MSTERILYRRELTPGIILEAHVQEYYDREDFVEASTLESFTLEVFGQVQDLLPSALKGTEEAFSRLGDQEAALMAVVDEEYRLGPLWKARRAA